MNENNTWKEVGDDVSEISKKLNDKIISKQHLDDLKNSLQGTLNSTTNLINNLKQNVENSIQDEEIRKDSRDLIEKIKKEFEASMTNIKNSVQEIIFDSEEE